MANAGVETISATVAIPDEIEATGTAWLLSFGSENTRNAYRRDFTAFVRYCVEHDLEPLQLRRVHIDAYARTLEADGRSPATVARNLSTLSSFYRYAEGEELIERNPMALVKRPRVANTSQTFGPNRDQVVAMIEAAAMNPLDHALILLLVTNGLRVSEAIALDAENLDTERDHRVIEVIGKGGRVDRIAIPSPTSEAIDALGIEAGPLFTDSSGGRLNRHQVTRIVKRVARAAGMDGNVSPHSLRHSAVTIALDAGVPLHRVQDMARHADPRTTRRYDQARGALDGHAAYAIASYLSN
jgi:integrase/recombinase XerD